MAKFSFNKDSKKAVGQALGRKFIIKLSVFVLICLVGIAAILAIVYYSRYDEMKNIVDVDTIYNNVYVDGTNVGGLTKEQAIKLLEEKAKSVYYDRTLILTYGADDYTFTYADFGVTLDIPSAVDTAYNYARSGSLLKRYYMIKELNNQAWYTESAFGYDSDKIFEAVKSIEDKIYEAPVNASIKKVDGEFVTEKGRVGHKLDVEATAKAVEEMVSVKNYGGSSGAILVITEEIEPEYTEEDFDKSTDVIGTYSTKYSGGASARVTNMQVAANRLNGRIIYPEEVFSTNECFGESTEANGYKPAGAIVSGKLVNDYGGGVCQVSSTLYNAVLYAELEVVERQNHSLKVGYLDYGFDATLAGDYIDFKFKNNTKYPIYIEASVGDNQVLCSIYGNEIRPATRTLKFENALIETVSPGAEKVVYDSNLAEGTKKTTVSALRGYKYKVYKLIYENDELVEKTLVNDSYYKPRPAEVIVGTKKPVENKPQESAPQENKPQESNSQESIPQKNTPPAENTPQENKPQESPPQENTPPVIEENNDIENV